MFEVPSGKLLDFLVSHRGIEANPNKVWAIEEMRPQTRLKEMQHLAGCVAALARFISKLGKNALSFFKIMKHTGKFQWALEANEAFEALKRYLMSPPIMVAPREREPRLLYLAAMPQIASVVLVADHEEVVDKKRKEPVANPLEASGVAVEGGDAREKASGKADGPVYFISTVLRHARERYPTQQKFLYALLVASRKLYHYFQGHPIKVVTKFPLETILPNPNATGRMAEWAIELQPFELTFDTTPTVHGRALAEFTKEWSDLG